ncbi:MAG: hypothetical protein GWN85_21895, partial [Gemmatimonadetes bacterium]|nr:hypothetical protein [Gemmatimonadota bacterium]NIV56659.1 hypothetical protein [Actinomycetota bacterium]NIU54700.1 hypothetical protein [Gemmatimonadota bacterium]NIW38620.1 hypothetical protein [Gemmatimonadota bacterium]NIX22073.1 hypothetical protein [Actinomycetota bacterium]
MGWEFTGLLTLGGEESGPESFYRVGRGLVDADGRGRIYVLDPTNARVVVFDAEGDHI